MENRDLESPSDRGVERSDRRAEPLCEAGQAGRPRLHVLRPLPPPGAAARRWCHLAAATITTQDQNPFSPVERVDPDFYASTGHLDDASPAFVPMTSLRRQLNRYVIWLYALKWGA